MTKIGRNDPCPCGSGKKYKKCCLAQHQQQQPYEQQPLFEQLDEIEVIIEKGNGKAALKKTVEACTVWEEAWNKLKERITPEVKSIEKLDQKIGAHGYIENWCQDFEIELHNAGLEDPSFFEKRINFCREFVELLPESDSLIILNMRRAEAESYFAVGKQTEGESRFKSLVEDFPHSEWGYIGWGDMYWLMQWNDKIPVNYEKAEKIYRKALAKNVEDEDIVLERLKDLQEQKSSKTK